jgi:class 3 adenylate cyclase
MATLSSVNKRAYTKKVPLFFFLALLLFSVVPSELFYFYSHNLVLSLIVCGGAVAVFCLWWFLFQWQTAVTWLCRLQIVLFKTGALPDDYRFSDDGGPLEVQSRIDDVVKTASTVVQETKQNLATTRHTLDKYLGSQASRHAVKDGSSSTLGGQLQNVFILFSDIRGFTAMTEELNSQETMRTLNQIFSLLSVAVEKQGGEINKFIGDAILAYFKRSPDPESERSEGEKVLKAAFEMHEKFTHVVNNNNELKAHNVKIGLGIGIVAGKAIMGNLGSRNRMEFTLIGESVNLASRLCSITPENEILVNEQLAMLVNDKFHIESRMPVQLKGMKEKTTPYCVLGPLSNLSRNIPDPTPSV